MRATTNRLQILAISAFLYTTILHPKTKCPKGVLYKFEIYVRHFLPKFCRA